MTESQKERKAIDGLREKMIDVLAGKTPAVFMAWNNVNPPKSEQMKGLAEQFLHDLFAHEDCPEAALITALYDDSVRIKMREYIERSINDAAACTVGQMTQQRLDEVAYGYR